jgi:flagellum-specific ATP synthase
MSDVAGDDHRKAARELLSLLAVYRENEDLINLGAYAKGSNPQIDLAIRMRDRLLNFVKQDRGDSTSETDSHAELLRMAQAARVPVNTRAAAPRAG